MPGPPDHIPAQDLVALLNQAPRPHRVVDFPRLNADGKAIGTVAIWVLTQEEQMACNATAEQFAKKLLKDGRRDDLGYETLFNNEGAVQVLYRACRKADDLSKPAFPTPEFIRSKLTADECGMLFEHYLTVQLELGPVIAKMSDEEFEAWVQRLDEGGGFFFDLLSSEVKKILALSMARRLRHSSTDSSSAGSPPDGEPAASPDSPKPPSDETGSGEPTG